MSNVLDLKINGSPSALRSAAVTVRDVTKSLTSSDTTLRAIKGRSEDAWTGLAADTFRFRLESNRRNLDDCKTSLDAGANALDDFAGELDAANSKMSTARQIAVNANLSVTDTTINMPISPGDQAEDAVIEEFNRKVQAWNKAVEFHDDARIKEKEAHSNLERDLKKAIDLIWLQDALVGMGVIPERGRDPLQLTAWGLGLAGEATEGVVNWKNKVQFGRFAPRGPDGRFLRIDSLSRIDWAARANNDKQWMARSNQAVNYRWWAKAGNFVGKASGPIAFASSAVDTWIEDSDDPSFTTSERFGRSAATGGMSALGASGGAWAGAAVGTLILPGVGTVVGGVIGGMVGGYGGSWVGDAVKDWVGGAARNTTDAVTDVADSVGEAVSNLKFW